MRKQLHKVLFLARQYGLKEAALACLFHIFKKTCSCREYTHFPPGVAALRCEPDFSATSSAAWDTMAVIIHCYHVAVLDEMLPWLHNLPEDMPCFVSTDTEDKKESIEKKFSCLSLAQPEVRVLPNYGFDMGPFFIGFRDVLLQKKLVLKLHCKLSPQKKPQYVVRWKRQIFSSLLGSREHVAKILSAFAASPRLGVAAPVQVPMPKQQGINHAAMHLLLQAHQIGLPRSAAIDFPAGSMFWCRTRILRPWLALNLTYEDFGPTNKLPRDGTLAHALERLIFFGCGIENMHWCRIEPADAVRDA